MRNKNENQLMNLIELNAILNNHLNILFQSNY